MRRLLLALSLRRLAHQGLGRAALSVCGIALGVALGYGVELVNGAAVRDLAASVKELSGGADLQVHGTHGGFPESLYPKVARVPGVASVAPGLELDAGIAGTARTVRIVGFDTLRQPQLVPDPSLRTKLLRGEAVVSESLDEELAGKPLRLVVGAKTVTLAVAGSADLKGEVALLDIAAAQWRFERLGELNRLDVRVKASADQKEVRRRIAALLPPGVSVSSVGELEDAAAYPSRAYRVNMNVLALVALFTGGFLVFSAQALEAARRRGEHALLRVLGLRAGELVRLVLAEAALLGALGAALGLAGGYALAGLALRATGGDLGSGAFLGFSARLHFSLPAALAYFAAGIAVALAGALLPAMDAARTPAARALKAGDQETFFRKSSRAWPGLVLLAAGGGLSLLGPVRGLPLFGYLSIAFILFGAIALMPRIAAFVFSKILPRKEIPFVLALAQLRGAPGQAAVSLAGIVASFSLMVAMAVMVSSFRVSFDEWLGRVLPAQLYFRTAFRADTAYLSPAFEERVRALPQVRRVDFLRAARVQVDPRRPAVVLIARDHAPSAYPMVGKAYERRAGDPPPVWVSEAVSDLYGYSPGKRIELALGNAKRSYVVENVFRDYARQHGALLMERSDYVAATGDRKANDAAVWLAPGASAAQTMDALQSLAAKMGIGATLEVTLPGEIRERSLRIFDRSFAVTYAMEALAVLVGLFGLSSSLGAIVLARRREFGMLRHLGVTRAQIGAMLAAEGGLLAALGTLAGLACGAAVSLVLVRVVNRQSFNWSMELHPPYLLVVSLAGAVVLLGAFTAYLSGREAMSVQAVRAVREDW